MPNIAEWAAAGLDAIHLTARNSGGFMSGYAKLTASNTGTGSGMRRLKGAINAPFAIPEPNRKAIRGDNRRIATFQFENGNPNAFTLDMGVTDLNSEGFMQGSTLVTVGEWDFGIRGASNPTYQDMILLLTRDNSSQETGSLGTSGFENMLILNVNATPLGDDNFADSAEGGSRYACIADPADVTPWGVNLYSAFGLREATTIVWSSEYRCAMQAFVGDGAITAIPVDYTPASSSTAKAKVYNTATGVAMTTSSVSVGGKTVTVSVAPTSGVLYVVIYEVASY